MNRNGNPTRPAESPVPGNWHAGFGRRLGETHRSRHRQGAPSRPHTASASASAAMGTELSLECARHDLPHCAGDDPRPVLAFPPEVRRVIYTTRLSESMNARLRKATHNGGQFPSEQSALKVLYMAVRYLEEFRSSGTGIRSSGWKQALQAFTIYFDGRIPTP